jgi:lipopolysaccharide transport system ATP-binding protein
MSDIAIRVEGLGKEYRIGKRERYKTLRDTVSDAVTAPVRWARSLARSSQTADTQDSSDLFWALKDVSFVVPRGAVVGIIGRNGAGKSTLLKILSRITQPTAGRVTLEGRVASLLEVGTGFHPELSGRENIFLNGAILGMSREEITRKFDEIVDFAGVEQFLDTPVKRYSSGMYVRLAFAIAAHLEQEILIVDEVLAVGDSHFQKKCLGKIGEVARGGRTVLFVSHQMATVENLCQTGLLLDRGRTKLFGSARDVIAAYMNDGAAQKLESMTNRIDRQGNGVLRFSAVRIVDDRGVPLDALVCGGAAVIELRVHNPSRSPLRRLHVSMGVDNALGQRVTTWSTNYVGGDFPAAPPTDFAVHVRLPRISLVAGVYSYNLFSTVNGDVADWLLPAGSFNVEAGDYYGSGQLPGNRDGVFASDHSFALVP